MSESYTSISTAGHTPRSKEFNLMAFAKPLLLRLSVAPRGLAR